MIGYSYCVHRISKDLIKAAGRSSFFSVTKGAILRWPISATAKLTFPRQNLLFHGKTYFLTAKLTFSRQNLLFHGKTYFLTAKLTLPRQNLLFHGKTYFSTAKLTFSRQNLLSHGKTYFLTAKLTFPRQNLLFHGKTYFITAKLTIPRQNLLFHGKTYFRLPVSLCLQLPAFKDPGIFHRTPIQHSERGRFRASMTDLILHLLIVLSLFCQDTDIN